MKKINKTIITFALLIITSNTFAQMKYWTTPPKKWNMTTSTPSSTSIPNSSSPYSVANGAFDEAGNMLFYVKDDGVYEGTYGGYIGPLPDLYHPPYTNCNDAFNVLGSQIAIVPVPGSCKKFYVIYAKDDQLDGWFQLFYIIVDCSGSSPSITYDGSVYACTYYEPQPFIISVTGNTFAVSKIYTGTGASAKRFLYVLGDGNGIYKCEISSTGISTGSAVSGSYASNLTNADLHPIEVELSWGSNYLAWSSSNGTVHTVKLNPTNGTYDNDYQKYTISGAKGIEFSNSTSNPYLYVAAASDIKRIYTYNQAITNISWGSNDLSNTFLEYGKNGRIYGVSPTYSGSTLTGSKLVGIVGTSIITGITADIDSRHNDGNPVIDGIFTLPNQIDGEDYTYFNGLPKVNIANFTLNSNVVSDVCDNGTDNYCQNVPIQFNASYSGGVPVQYKIMIQAYDANTCSPTQLTGSGYINYQGSWTSGTPTTNLDLRTLTDGNSLNLGNMNTGTVKITYSTKDECDYESTYIRYIEIITYPTSPCYSDMKTNPNSKDEKSVNISESIILYPNPINKLLTISFNNTSDDVYEISLTDLLGRQTFILMPSTSIKKGTFKQTFNVSELPTGVYTYQIKSNNTIQTGKIVKN